MNDYEYEEENLDDFMINTASILSEKNNPEKEIMLESLKQHLSSIINKQTEIQNFYKILNMVIFNPNSNKIKNKQCFKIYPVVFSFNPNASFYHIDYFLSSLNQAIDEENHSDFAYLSVIFSEVVLSFYEDEKMNKNLINKKFLLENNKKYKLYEKLLNYCNEKIKTNEKTEQTLGCLLLSELIEKCPIVKEDQYLDSLFKILSEYLEDRWFECKIDLLNCTISLIFAAEKKFKPYANICLFRVLDYLTEEEWIKRKLAINIVYTLIFYCKEEIMTVKDNVVEFLIALKEDPVDEVREVCLQTLEFLEEIDDLDDGVETPKIEQENRNKRINSTNNKANYHKVKIKNKNKSQNKNENNYKSKIDDKNNINNSGNINANKDKKNYKQVSNFKIHKAPNIFMIKKKAKEEYLKKKLLKERDFLEKKEKELNEKSKSNIDINFDNLSNNKTQQSNLKSKLKPKQNMTINQKIKDFMIPDEKRENINAEEDSNPIIKMNENSNPLSNENIKLTLNGILKELNQIQHGHSQLLSVLNNLQINIDNNYLDLSQRINNLEKYYSKNSYIQKNINDNKLENPKEEVKDFTPNKEHKEYKENKNINIDKIKSMFIHGHYNDALYEAKQNEKCLFKLLPHIDKNIIPNIDTDNLEDIINILNKKLSVITIGNRNVLNDILFFYINLTKSKINLKLIMQLNIKDSLEFFKNKNNNKLLKSDINNIDLILKSLKV